MNLNDIALKYGTDKSSRYHNYCDIYEKFFTPFVHKGITLLEIGVLNGSSIRMWKEFFGNAKLIGVDIDEKCRKFTEKDLSIEIGFQQDIGFLQSLVDKYKSFDIIIDDGSHFGEDQVVTFEYLFPKLKRGGMYVLEDLHSNYISNYGGHGIDGQINPSRQSKISIIDYLKRIVDNINCDGTGGAFKERIPIIENPNCDFRSSLIKSIHFYTSTCIIERF